MDLARTFAQRLGVPLDMVVVHSAGKSVDEVARETADIGFFAIDPVRGRDVAFTAPYALIEGSYLVPATSPILSNEEVDHSGNRIVVGSLSGIMAPNSYCTDHEQRSDGEADERHRQS